MPSSTPEHAERHGVRHLVHHLALAQRTACEARTEPAEPVKRSRATLGSSRAELDPPDNLKSPAELETPSAALVGSCVPGSAGAFAARATSAAAHAGAARRTKQSL